MIPPPPVINPSAYVETFDETFQGLDAGPEAGRRWRTFLKAGAATDPSTRSLTSTTWFGDVSDGWSNPFKPNTYAGLAISAVKQSQPLGRTWRSGVATTRFSFSQLHGYFEWKASLPTCHGCSQPASSIPMTACTR